MRDDVKVADYFEDKVKEWKVESEAYTLESFLLDIRNNRLTTDFDQDPKFEVVKEFFNNNSFEQLTDIQESEFVNIVEKEEKPNVKIEVLEDTMKALENSIIKGLASYKEVDKRKIILITWISAIALFALVHSFSSSNGTNFLKGRKSNKLKEQYGTQ